MALFVMAVAGCATISAQSSVGAQAVAVQRALENLPDAETYDWNDPETGAPARLTLLSTEQRADGRYCRQVRYQADLDGDGTVETYCRVDETGDWEFVN